MNILIFGSNGTVGKQLLLQALAQGYNVRAFVRDAGKLADLQHNKLEVFTGDVFSLDAVTSSMKNIDAVLCALGDGRIGRVRAEGTKNIIKAMQQQQVSRLICQTTLGCGDSRDTLNFFWKHIMFGWFLKKAFLDHELQERYVFESDLDWTIVRPGAFTKGKFTGMYHHGFDGSTKGLALKISPADVASFMLKQLSSKQYLHKCPGLSY